MTKITWINVLITWTDIGAHTQNIPYHSIAATQDKTRAHDMHIDIGEGPLARCRVRRVLIMSKVRRNADTQMRKASMNYV